MPRIEEYQHQIRQIDDMVRDLERCVTLRVGIESRLTFTARRRAPRIEGGLWR